MSSGPRRACACVGAAGPPKAAWRGSKPRTARLGLSHASGRALVRRVPGYGGDAASAGPRARARCDVHLQETAHARWGRGRQPASRRRLAWLGAARRMFRQASRERLRDTALPAPRSCTLDLSAISLPRARPCPGERHRYDARARHILLAFQPAPCRHRRRGYLRGTRA
jgi:hypothetical protein